MRLLALVMGGVMLAGCAKATVTTEPTEPTTFAEIVAAAIEDATAGGAGDAQMAILRQAQVDGELPLETARATARAVVECVSDAGFSASYGEHTTGSGLVVPGYSSVVGTPEQMAIVDTCDQQENWWVFVVYTTQPTSRARAEAFLEQQVPLVRRCLVENGYMVPPDATTREVLRQAADVKMDTEPEVDCIWKFGIEGF